VFNTTSSRADVLPLLLPHKCSFLQSIFLDDIVDYNLYTLRNGTKEFVKIVGREKIHFIGLKNPLKKPRLSLVRQNL